MDDDSDKLNRFKEAFERGQKGEVTDYKAWLNENGIDSAKASSEFLRDYFQDHPQEAVNHEEQLEAVAEYMGFFSQRGGTYHLPIIGVSDIGKTQFLHTIQNLFTQIETEVPIELLDTHDFNDVVNGQQKIFEIADRLRETDQTVLLIDNCEWDTNVQEALRVLNQATENSFIITTWTPEAWRRRQEEVEDVLEVDTEVRLDRFSQQDTVEAVQQILQVVSDDGFELPEDSLQKIHEYSRGVPGLFTRLTLKTFREAFLKQVDLTSVEAVELAADQLNLVDAEERVYDLSESKMRILKHILLSTDPRGIRPTTLVEILDRDKSTISYHLQTLRSEEIVESEKQGRSAFYRVKDEIKPIVQQRIDQEGEFHG